MKLLTYRYEGRQAVGLLRDDRVLDLSDLTGATDVGGLVERWDDLRDRVAAADGPGVALDAVTLLAPIPHPHRNVLCVGKNYREHALEFGSSGYDSGAGTDGDHVPPYPVVFTKPASSVVGPDAAVESHPTVTKELDYEAELAVVLGRGGRDIAASEAAAHVWGYTVVNDVTARDRQRDHKQWFLGKGLDTFCPMGPYAVTADELDPEGTGRPVVEVTCHVNGELRQRASTADLLFDIPTLIEAISAGLTLEPGDVLATGTPAGVGIGFDPPRFLRPGDVVEVAISGIGTLRNRIS